MYLGSGRSFQALDAVKPATPSNPLAAAKWEFVQQELPSQILSYQVPF